MQHCEGHDTIRGRPLTALRGVRRAGSPCRDERAAGRFDEFSVDAGRSAGLPDAAREHAKRVKNVRREQRQEFG